MDVTRVEQSAYIKIAIPRRRNAMECHSELVGALRNNALPYRRAPRWVRKFQQGLCQPVSKLVTRFTHGAANSEAAGIPRLPHHWQRVVTVAEDYI
ncbi:HTH_48 domain-containing protein [Trichonephila clavata]|uniref:HTH_48 domain-containing protein n=1 Tax=Trichonephila clavata TaxID=2740835 RepID=A0A8X6FWS8_TRICU|nr:HTH_48 domain-containing protein [Trichonephila clavata]